MQCCRDGRESEELEDGGSVCGIDCKDNVVLCCAPVRPQDVKFTRTQRLVTTARFTCSHAARLSAPSRYTNSDLLRFCSPTFFSPSYKFPG